MPPIRSASARRQAAGASAPSGPRPAPEPPPTISPAVLGSEAVPLPQVAADLLFATPGGARRTITLLRLVEAMGLLAPGGSASTADAGRAAIGAALRAAAEAGIGQRAASTLWSGAATDAGGVATGKEGAAMDAAAARDALDEVIAALEESPVPRTEIVGLARVLGIERLAQLAGSSTASLRRYATGVRVAPDRLAARLHWLALVVGDLRGAYNDFGIRRWFDRHRAQLDGRAPGELLAGDWSPDDPEPAAVRELARALTGSGAT